MQTFIEYLEAKGYSDVPSWLASLDTQEIVELTEEYGHSMWFKGSRNAIIELNRAIEPLTLEDDEQLTREKRIEESEQAIISEMLLGNQE